MLKPIKISRSGLRLFLECPRCFWLEQHHKIRRPPSYPYTLSAAVDYLVKREFDKYRIKGELPPVFAKFFEANPAQNLSADRQQKGRVLGGVKLYPGEELADWRNNFRGIGYQDEDLGATLYGAIDDILQFPDGSLAVVDYKSSGSKEITIYDDYQKQMDVYAYILSRMGRQTHPEAYFVFYQVDKSGNGFANALNFREELRNVKVDAAWVPGAFEQAVKIARQEAPPQASPTCTHCQYVQAARAHLPSAIHSVTSDEDYRIVKE